MQDNAKKPAIRFVGFHDEWEQRKFADLFDTVANNTLSRAELTADTGAGRDVHYGDILVKLGECLRDVSELPFIADDQTVQKFISARLQNGDVIIADTAEDETVGKCTEILDVQGEIVLSGLHTIPCRPREKFAPAYLGYFMNSPAYHDQLRPLMQGIKVTSVSKSALQDTVLSMPKSQTEQGQIGQFFLNLDHLITLHQRKCDETKELKKFMLQKMFPQGNAKIPEIRFAGFSNDWEQRKLGESIEECTSRTSDFSKYPLFSLTIENGVTEKNERYERGFLVTKTDDLFKLVPPSCFVTNPMNLRFGAIGCNRKPYDVSVSGYYDVFSIDDGQCSEFWNAYLKTQQMIKRYDDVATGSLIEKRRVHFTELKKLEVPAPADIEEKRKIGVFFLDLDHLIALHQRKCDELKSMKKFMLQNMFV